MENIQSFISEVVLSSADVPEPNVDKIFKFEHID
jgi:hypothetical protein